MADGAQHSACCCRIPVAWAVPKSTPKVRSASPQTCWVSSTCSGYAEYSRFSEETGARPKGARVDRFCSARLNNPVLNCRSAELVLCRASIGRGAKDGERGAECGEPVECAGGRRGPDAPEPGGNAAEPVAASACGAPPHRAPPPKGRIPAKIAHWPSRADLSNEISGADSVKSQFHATGNPFSPRG
jgi:hypothetical protein